MSDVRLPELVRLRLDEVRPYERNPRRIPPEAVAAVRSSLEKYGYQQPIVVDTEHVIVAGHTRYAAMLEMGVAEADFYVTDLPAEKAAAYRLVDNRVSENSEWDHDALVMELREFEQGLLTEFFPHVDLEIDSINATLADVTDADTAKASKEVNTIKDYRDPLTTKVECPACYGTFEVRTESLPGLTRTDLEMLEAAADAHAQAAEG